MTSKNQPKNSPLVSIGMPIYNGERHMKRAIDSLLAQDYANFELIISDNASSDRTADICEEYLREEPRISFFQNTSNIGIVKNLKEVLKRAHGEFFMWAAADDYWSPQFLSVMLKELKNHQDSGVSMCAVRRINASGEELDTIRFNGKHDPRRLTHLGVALRIVSPLKYNLFIYGLFKTQLLKMAIPLFPNISSSDRWFLLQIALAARFRYVDEILHVRMSHELPYQERYPHDELGRNKAIFDKRYFDFGPLSVVSGVIANSKIVPWYRKPYLLVVLPYLFYRRVVPGVLRILRYDGSDRNKRSVSESFIYCLSLSMRGLIHLVCTSKMRARLLGVRDHTTQK